MPAGDYFVGGGWGGVIPTPSNTGSLICRIVVQALAGIHLWHRLKPGLLI